jgi:hypothetical protein
LQEHSTTLTFEQIYNSSSSTLRPAEIREQAARVRTTDFTQEQDDEQEQEQPQV